MALVKSDQRFCEAFLLGTHGTPSLTFRSGPFNQNANSLFEEFNLLVAFADTSVQNSAEKGKYLRSRRLKNSF